MRQAYMESLVINIRFFVRSAKEFPILPNMSSSLRHLNALRAFEAAARHSSFAKAAGELHISHSVVSEHVKNLELWLGTELFIRHGNRITLSEDGRSLLPHLTKAFQILRDACYGLLRMSQSGALTIVAEPAIATRILRQRISAFCTEFPHVEVDLIPAWQAPQLGEGHADMIIHFDTRMPASGAVVRKLFPIDGYPACTSELKEQLMSRNGEVDYSDLPLIHDNGRQIWQQWYSTFYPDCMAWQHGRVHSNLSLAIEAAVDGEGVVLADDILCARELKSGALVKLDARETRCIWYSMAVAKDTSPNTAVVSFQNWLIEKNLERAQDVESVNG